MKRPLLTHVTYLEAEFVRMLFKKVNRFSMGITLLKFVNPPVSSKLVRVSRHSQGTGVRDITRGMCFARMENTKSGYIVFFHLYTLISRKVRKR